MNEPYILRALRALTDTVTTVFETVKEFQARLDAVEKLVDEMNHRKDEPDDEPES